MQRRVGHVHLLLVGAGQKPQPSLLIGRTNGGGFVLSRLVGGAPCGDPGLQLLAILRRGRSTLGHDALSRLMRTETLLPMVARVRLTLVYIDRQRCRDR